MGLCFKMIPNIRYRILPCKATEFDNISYAIGQRWDLISPILLALGFLLEKERKLKSNLLKFQNLDSFDCGDLKTNMSDMHPKGDTRQYFLCRFKPLFASPEKKFQREEEHIYSCQTNIFL